MPYTRKIIDAIHSGSLLEANYKKTEVFGLEIPTEVEGVPTEILDPVNTVSCLLDTLHTFFSIIGNCDFQFQCADIFDFGLQWSDKKAYQDALLKLAGLFKNNFETFTSYKIGKDNKLTEEILAAGPNF